MVGLFLVTCCVSDGSGLVMVASGLVESCSISSMLDRSAIIDGSPMSSGPEQEQRSD